MEKLKTKRVTSQRLHAIFPVFVVLALLLLTVEVAVVNQDQHITGATAPDLQSETIGAPVPVMSSPGLNLTHATGIATESYRLFSDSYEDRQQQTPFGSDYGKAYCLSRVSAPTPTGNLNISVAYYAGFGWKGLTGVSVVSTSQPEGQSQLVGLTDYRGMVYFSGILAGYYDIYLNKTGFKNESVRSISVEAGQTAQHAFILWSVSDGSTTNGDATATSTTNGGVTSSQSNDIVSISIAILVLGVALGIIKLAASTWNRSDSAVAEVSSEPEAEQVESASGELVEDHEHTLLKSSPNRCPYCGVGLPHSAVSLCWNCRASLSTSGEMAVLDGEQEKALTIMGKCIVCNLEVDSDDVVLWCPHCGNAAHKTHMLEWLHVKDYCPACQQHLEERDLKYQPPERKPLKRQPPGHKPLKRKPARR